MKTPEMYAVWRGLHRAQGESAYHLECFGDELAQKHGYKGLDGMEAVRYYLMQKHHWLPRDVMSMSAEEMRFALHEEMQSWTLPKAAIDPADR